MYLVTLSAVVSLPCLNHVRVDHLHLLIFDGKGHTYGERVNVSFLNIDRKALVPVHVIPTSMPTSTVASELAMTEKSSTY